MTGFSIEQSTILTVKQLRGLLFLLPVQNIPVNSAGTTVADLRAMLAQVDNPDAPVVEVERILEAV